MSKTRRIGPPIIRRHGADVPTASLSSPHEKSAIVRSIKGRAIAKDCRADLTYIFDHRSTRQAPKGKPRTIGSSPIKLERSDAMTLNIVALAVMMMAGATAVTACTTQDKSQQTGTGSSGEVQTQSQGYDSDYGPLGQDHHHR
jgi:hypothetical protein